MKKLAVLAVLAMAVVASGVTPASATCLTFTNFCDRIQLHVDGAKNAYGIWDWTCNGVDLTSIIGRVPGPDLSMGTRPVYAGFPFQYSTNFVFHKDSQLFDLYGTEGTVIFAFQLDQPWTITPGKCGFAGSRISNKPPMLGNR
jgi:hypothetical protein